MREPNSDSPEDSAFVEALKYFRTESFDFTNELQLRRCLESASRAVDSDQIVANWVDSNGYNLIWYAAKNGYVLVADLLLQYGADPSFSRVETGPRMNAVMAQNSALISSLNNIDITEKMLNYMKKSKAVISPELTGLMLCEVSKLCTSFGQSRKIRNIANWLLDVCSDINKPIIIDGLSDEECPILAHAASKKELSHLVLFLLDDKRVRRRGESLCAAASTGNFDGVELLLNNCDIQNEKYVNGALIYACRAKPNDCNKVAESLINEGANPNWKDAEGVNAVIIAVKSLSFNLLSLLLERGGNPIDGFDQLPHEYSAKGMEILNLLLFHLEKNGSENWINEKKNGKPVVTLLAQKCAGEYVQKLLQKGADLELKDDGKHAKFHTPLDWAVRSNNKDAAQVLIEAGANVNAYNGAQLQTTCFHSAVEFSSIEILDLFIGCKKLDPNLKMRTNDEKKGSSALHLAVGRGNLIIISKLLGINGININLAREGQYTPLHDAVLKCCNDSEVTNFEIVVILLENGASPNKPDYRGNTPLMAAVEGQHLELAKELIYKGADLEFMNTNNDSPLSIASENLKNPKAVDIMKKMLLFLTEEPSKPQFYMALREKVKSSLASKNYQIVAALGLIMMESAESRKIITDSSSLWKLDSSEISSSKHPNSCWWADQKHYEENMLTWAIRKSAIAANILLTSNMENTKLPHEWRSNLCIRPTSRLGSPLRYAIDAENNQAVANIMEVLKSVWSYQFSIKSRQRHSEHPLDILNSHDLLLVINYYPEIFYDFVSGLDLVPVYSWVAGINRAPISRTSIWVALSKQRSPANTWERYVKRNRKLFDSARSFKRSVSRFFIRKYFTGDKYDESGEIEDDDSDVPYELEDTRKHWEVFFDKIRFLFKDITHHNMRLLLYNRDFKGNFDIDASSHGTIDMIPLITDLSKVDKQVEAFMVPIKEIASFEIIYACVKAYDRLLDPELFNSTVLTAIIQLHWRLYAYRKHILNLFLHLFLLICIVVQSIYVEEKNLKQINGVEMAWLFLMQFYKVYYSLFFTVHDLLQLKQSGDLFGYIKDPWNAFDLPCYTLLITSVIFELTDNDFAYLNNIKALVSLLVWFKLLYFMRPFRLFGPMVYMIFQVAFDIKIFLVILFIVIIGFGNAFYIVLNDSVPSFGGFFFSIVSAFSFSMGNYDVGDVEDSFYSITMWIMFMIIVSIILLNLLIAIISESYTRVSEIKLPAWRLEQARVILDIYAGMTHQEKDDLKEILKEYPWLQILKPSTLKKSSPPNVEGLARMNSHSSQS